MARYKSRQEVQLCRGNANSMPNPRQMEAVNPRDQTDANLGKHEKSQISWATKNPPMKARLQPRETLFDLSPLHPLGPAT